MVVPHDTMVGNRAISGYQSKFGLPFGLIVIALISCWCSGLVYLRWLLLYQRAVHRRSHPLILNSIVILLSYFLCKLLSLFLFIRRLGLFALPIALSKATLQRAHFLFGKTGVLPFHQGPVLLLRWEMGRSRKQRKRRERSQPKFGVQTHDLLITS